MNEIKAANFDENGLPTGPDPKAPRDTRRQQTRDSAGTAHWNGQVRALQTDYMRKHGYLACSDGGEKVVKKMHALKSLPTPGYDEARDPLVQQEGDQDAHADEPIDRVRQFTRDEDVPLSTILAIMPGTCLRIRPFGGAWIIVTLEPGDLLIFRGDVCHNGLGYANENVRVHAYVYHPAYNPGASSLNAC